MKKTEILKDLITKSGLNQKQFAERHEIDKTRLNRLLKGVWDIRTPELENIALKEGYTIKWNYELLTNKKQ
jgi:transcriptional regulator with XRE-family HTH domain